MIKKKSKKNKFLYKVILFFNIIIALCLVISYFAAYIPPDKFWTVAFFGISYPIFLLLNLLFILIWLILKRKYTLISTIVIIIGYNNLFRLIQSSEKYPKENFKNAIKVISFNVRNFDIYNYKNNYVYSYSKRDMIFDFLNSEQPDILCFQEYVYDNKKKFKTTDTLKDFLNAKKTHIVFTKNSRNTNYFGIATYSKFPVSDTGRIAFKTISGNICIFTDIVIYTDTVRIYNVHFESIRLGKEDYMFAEKLSKNNNENIDLKNNSERILKRLKRAFIFRALQARLVAEHISNCPYPVIVCGDFNDTPASYAYHLITSDLKDAFVESGNGTGQTYAGVFPSFRIDYILHSKEFKARNFETVDEEMSDHYPIKCFLEYKK